MSLDAEDIKRAAAGRWDQILVATTCLSVEQVTPKHRGPCPRCGGHDRFNPLKTVRDTGGLWCRKCHNRDSSPRGGDGLAAIQWLNNCSFPDALKMVAAEVNDNPHGLATAPSTAANGAGGAKLHDTLEAAATALGWSLTQSGAIPEDRQPDSVWQYHDADGSDVGAVLRWNTESGKEIRQVRCEAGGWVCRAMNEPRLLYGMPLIATADTMTTIYVLEGEKSADAGRQLGLCCVASSGGSGAASKSDWSVLNNRNVVIIPDHDDPGEKYAADVVALCAAAGAASVGVLRLPLIWPQCPSGGDLADYSEYHDSKTAEELRAAIESVAVEYIDQVDADEDDLQPVDAWHASFSPRPHADCLIEGLLRRGEVCNVIAATKAGKSWFVLQLLQSIAAGRDWLGRRVARGAVVLVDNELQPATLENRLANVRDALRIEQTHDRARFEYISLRGNWRSLPDLSERLCKRYKPGELAVIVFDAKYRFFGDGFEENSNDSQTRFHNLADELASNLNCGLVLVHHATKGNQTQRSVTDLGSGGGAQSRAADSHITIRDHQTDGCSVLQAAVRSFAPAEPQTIRFAWPLWYVDSDMPPILASPTAGVGKAQMCERIRDNLTDEWQTLYSLATACRTQTSRTAFKDAVADMENAGELETKAEYKSSNGSKTVGIRRMPDSESLTVSANTEELSVAVH